MNPVPGTGQAVVAARTGLTSQKIRGNDFAPSSGMIQIHLRYFLLLSRVVGFYKKRVSMIPALARVVIAGLAYWSGGCPRPIVPSPEERDEDGPAPNHSPECGDPEGRTVSEGEILEFQVEARDPDRDPLLYSSRTLPEGASLSSSGLFRWRPHFEQQGPHRIDVEVADRENVTDCSFQVGVNNVNRPPALFLPQGQTIGEMIPTHFSLDALDPDGDTLLFSASMSGDLPLPEGALFHPIEGNFSWTPTCLQAGTYLLLFAVSDEGSPSLQDVGQVEIIVQDRCPLVGWTQIHESPQGKTSGGTAIAVDKTDGERLYVAGNVGMPWEGKGNIWMAQLDDSGGDTIWTRTYGDPEDKLVSVAGIAPDDTGIYLAGYRWLDAQNSHVLLMKTDHDGNELWRKTIPTATGLARAHDIVVAGTNVYVTGFLYIPEEVVWTHKMDREGNEIWSRTLGLSLGSRARGYGISVDSSGSVIVTGGMANFVEGPDGERTFYPFSIFTAKMDPEGNATWVRFGILQDREVGEGHKLTTDLDGSIYMAGSHSAGLNSSILSRKLDPAGHEIWTRIDSDPEEREGAAYDIALGPEGSGTGNLYLTGVQDFFLTGDAFLRKMDTAGNTHWTETYDGPNGSLDLGMAVALGTEGKIYVIGSSENAQGNYDIWVRQYKN